MEGKVKAMCCCDGRSWCEGWVLEGIGEILGKECLMRISAYLKTSGGAVGFLEARHSD